MRYFIVLLVVAYSICTILDSEGEQIEKDWQNTSPLERCLQSYSGSKEESICNTYKNSTMF